jgi:hypothetical protein
LIINGWRNDSAALDDLQAQVKAHNEEQEKSNEIGTKLEKSNVVYRQRAYDLGRDIPVNDYSVTDAIRLWLEAGIEAGEASFKRNESVSKTR